MLIGYVRVSTNEQNTALQRNALESAGCELIFEDKASGKKAERPGLKKVLRILSRGDTLIVWKLDRLGRSMRHLVVLVEELRDRGINFRSLTDSIDTSTPMGRFFWHCCKVSDEAAFCLIQRPYISKTLLTRRISPRGSP
ncbi:recombinase family protein [Salmonella enterica]|uniref:recombinase family protein n=2 Tax=Salmonella TaxID=590 RepID=UPI00403F7B9B